MGFLDIGSKKHQGQHRQEHLRLLSNDGNWVTFHRLTTYHLFLGSHFGSELLFTRHWTEFIGNMPPPTTTRAFVGYLSFFLRKVRVSRFTQKPFGLKNVFKSPPRIWSKKYFLEISLKIPNSRGEKMDDYGRIIQFLPNLGNFPISRSVRAEKNSLKEVHTPWPSQGKGASDWAKLSLMHGAIS